MARKTAGRRRANDEPERNGATPPTSTLVVPAADAPAALLDLAEELGRLLARRLLADRGRRRGYSLPETLLGAAIMAVVWVLIARALGWLVH